MSDQTDEEPDGEEIVEEVVEDDAAGDGQPRQIVLSVRSIVTGFAVLIVAIGLGVGGYFVGKGTGEDLESARAEGQAAGKKSGTAKGTAQGFKRGFKKGKAKGYEKSFGPAYKDSYIKAYEEAGLDPPDKKEIEVPKR